MLDLEIVRKGGNFEMCSAGMRCKNYDNGSGCIPTLAGEAAPCEVILNRFSYHSPKAGQNEKYEAIRCKAKELAWLIENECPDSQEKSTAHTRLQEVVMWANASIAING